MLLPDSMELRVCVPFNSRSTAWASFDGRGRVELKRTYSVRFCYSFYSRLTSHAEGDHIKITASKYPFPTVCADNQSTDWFHSISRTLKWNERERQKSFVVVEEGPEKHKPKEKKHPLKSSHVVENGIEKLEEEDEVSDEEEGESDEEEEEEKYDIDDLSSTESPNRSEASHEDMQAAL